MQAFTNPSQRFRQALATCSSSSPSLEHLVRLADRLPSTSTGQADLRNTDPQTRETSLHIAARRGRVDVVQWLMEEDHDEGEVSRDAAGDTVVHLAASLGHIDILHLYLARYPFVVLIDVGADINAPDLVGNSPLHMASSYGKLPVVRLLIDLGCQTDSRNSEGFSAADYAFSFSMLKELESLIRQRAEQVKEAKRAARAQRKARSSPDTVRSRRRGDSTTLSIALPPAPSRASSGSGYSPSPTADPATSPDSMPPTSSAFGLGLSYSATSSGGNNGTTSPALLATSGIPSLGSPIPPTPFPPDSPDVDYSPSLGSSNGLSSSNAFPYRPTPIRPSNSRSPSEASSNPQTPTSPYHNTTSPQPSPISPSANSSIPPWPTGGSTANSTPARSLLSLRRVSRAPPGSSPLSTPTCTAPPPSQLGEDVFNPSPASALSAETNSTGISSSGQTATPTPASPTPASPRQGAPRQDALFAVGEMQYPALVAAPHPVDSLLDTTSPSASPPTSPPYSPPRPSSGHKLVRKARSHAQHPSVTSSTIPEGHEPSSPSSSFQPRSAMGGRSVSTPAGTGGGRDGTDSMDSSRKTPPMQHFFPAGSKGGVGVDGEKSVRGSKLKKEKHTSHHSHGLGHGALGSLGLRRASTVESHGSGSGLAEGGKGSRLKRVFGLGRKG
ncbi:hypothetical protein JCM11251_006594 [Rhodosporidiobolus azoricus]